MSSLNKLQNENDRINQQIKIQKDLTNKYKLKLTQIEKEKANLLLTNQKKEKKINEDNNKINELKKEIENIKLNLENENNDNKKENSNFEKEKYELKQKQQLNDEKINELQEKILKLENQLKNENESKRQSKDISLLYNLNNSNNNGDFFLTGNELNELKDKHERLIKNIEENNLNLNNIKAEKENLENEYEEIEKEKEEYNSKIIIKNEELEKILNENNIVSNSFYENKMSNQKLIINFNNLKIKFKALSIDKNDLEEVILKQEGKVNELNNNVSKIIALLNQKNSEIDDNKMYISKLKETIDELNDEFNKLKSKKEKAKKDEIKNLKNELMSLKLEKERNSSLSKANYSAINDNLYNYPKKNRINGKIKLKKIKNASALNEKLNHISKLSIKEPNNNYKPLYKNKNNIYDSDDDTEEILDNSNNFIEKTSRQEIKYQKVQNNDIENIKNIDINENYYNKSFIINNSKELIEIQDKEKITEFKSMLDNLLDQF